LNLEQPAMLAPIAPYRSSLAVLISEASILTHTKSCDTGSGELEFGTTCHACSHSHLAVHRPEVLTSRSLTSNQSCSIGSGEPEFGKTHPAFSYSHLAVLILEASTLMPCQTYGTGFGEFEFRTASCACTCSFLSVADF
jgi:hypothetical protein